MEDEGEDIAGPGHNSDLTDEQEQALFFNHLGVIKRHKEKLASITGELRGFYRVAKSEGFTKKAIDHAIAIEKDEDGALAEQRLMQEKIERWMAHPLGEQAELFARANPAPGPDRAYNAGFRSGSEGMEMCKPPEAYAFDRDVEQAWITGWQAGQGALADIRAPLFTQEQAEGQADFETFADGGGNDEGGEADFTEIDGGALAEAEAALAAETQPAKPKRTAKGKAKPDYNETFRKNNRLPRVGKGAAAKAEPAPAGEGLGDEQTTYTEH